MATIKNLLVGADIEVFLKNKEGKFISSVGLIGGSKDEPKKLSDKGHAVQEDNVAAEFNIPPTSSPDEFVKEIRTSLYGLQQIINPQDLVIDLSSSAIFDEDQLQTPEAKEFGCSPDYDAYELVENAKPGRGVNPRLRSIGGHIHIGYDEPDMMVNQELIVWLDALLALPALLIDKDVDRRKLYGKAGAFRPKSYGVEYRTLSSFWIGSDKLMQWVFNGVKTAVSNLNNGMEVPLELRETIRECINENNTARAAELCESYQIQMPNKTQQLIAL